MTSPDVPTKLGQARTALHAALVETMAACGWQADRAQPLPPRQIVPPMGWVDAARLSEQPGGNGSRAVVVTFPVCVSVDGADREQVQQLDALMVNGWAAFDRVKLEGDRPGAQHAVRVLSAGPEFIELPSGAETRAVVFSVQMTLQVRTLCSGAVTASDEAQPTP